MKATGKASGPSRDHYWRAGAPTGRTTAHPSKKQARKKNPLMAGVLLVARVSKANHMAYKVPNGLDAVAKTPRYSVGVLLVNCHPNHFRNDLQPRCHNVMRLIDWVGDRLTFYL